MGENKKKLKGKRLAMNGEPDPSALPHGGTFSNSQSGRIPSDELDVMKLAAAEMQKMLGKPLTFDYSPSWDDIQFCYRGGGNYGFSEFIRPIERPAPLQHAPRVEDLIGALALPIRRLGFYFSGKECIPKIQTVQRLGNWPITLTGYGAELRGSPREKVAQARKIMLDLLAHEVDEWLWVAGLGEDPHEAHNELERQAVNSLYEQGTASL